MSILRDVIAELFGMFVADARLTLAILCLVAAVAVAIDVVAVPPLLGGVALLVGTLGIVIGAVVLAARRG